MYLRAFLSVLLQFTSQVATAPLSRLGSPLECSFGLDHSSGSDPRTPASIFAIRRSFLGMYTWPSFALFALVEVSTETLNSLLQQAHDGSTVDQWWWYLATPDYRAAPQLDPEGPKQTGTKSPINPAFSSQFIGKGLDDAAQWLVNKPASVDTDKRFFGVVDKQTARTGKIAVCRLNDPKKEKEVAWCILKPADESTLYLGGLDSDLDWVDDVRHGKYEVEL